MEADLQRYYGVELVDLYRGRLSVRRLFRLVEALPAGAQVYQAMNDRRAWTDGEHLLADAVDALNVIAWQRTKDAQRNRNRPERLVRPGDPPRAEKTTYGGAAETVEEIEAWLRDITERQRTYDETTPTEVLRTPPPGSNDTPGER